MRLTLVLGVALGVSTLTFQAQVPQPASTALSAGAAAPTTSAISGVVVDGVSGQPVGDTIVQLVGVATSPPSERSEPRVQHTDERGRFVFRDLEGDRTYGLSGRRHGYVLESLFVASTGSASRIALKPGEWVRDARVTIWPAASISGTILDETGAPIVGGYVRALPQVVIDGRLETSADQMSPPARTDDRGHYRIFNLPQGRYLVAVASVQHTVLVAGAGAQARTDDGNATSARVAGPYTQPSAAATGRSRVYPPLFYPAARSIADATPIPLRHGEQRAGVDLRVASVPTARVTGTIDAPPDAGTGWTLRLFAKGHEKLGAGSETATATVAPDGTFAFFGVPSGSYSILVSDLIASLAGDGQSDSMGLSMLLGGLPNRPPTYGSAGLMGTRLQRSLITPRPYWGHASVDVRDTDVDGVTVSIRQGSRITGEIVVDDASGPLPASAQSLLVAPSLANTLLVLVDPKYTPATPPANQPPQPRRFEAEGLVPGKYYLTQWRGNSAIKTVVWQGRDVTDQPFDVSTTDDIEGVVVTITSNVGRITGNVLESAGARTADAAVIFFPVDRAQWPSFVTAPGRLGDARPDLAGRYEITGLQAGDYFVAAVPITLRKSWHDPNFLASVAGGASRVRVDWGATATQDLRIQRVAP